MPYINADDILAARQIDLLSYLQTYEPGELVHLQGNTYCTREHDSLKISNGKWHWFSRGIGGRTALDYLVKVKEMSFPDAVRLLTGAPIQTYVPPKEYSAPKERKLLLPEVDTDCEEVRKYLQGRGIHPTIIDYCIENKLLFQTANYKNALFVGYDNAGKPRYGALRSTFSAYKSEATGSDKRYSFSIAANSATDVRFDSRHVRLKKGETEKSSGGYEYRWTTPDGKRHSVYAPTLEKLRELEEQIAVDKRDGIKADIRSLTVNDCFKLWRELKRGIKDSTFKNYIYMYEMFVMPTFGKKRVVQVQKSDVKRFYNSLVDNKVLSISTVDNIHNVLHQVFQVAVDDNYIRQNPTDRMLKELRVAHGHEVEKRKALTLSQQELLFKFLLETPRYRHWYPVFYIMANTGMRVGEITGLRWRDVDMENGVISVNHTLVYYNHQDEIGTYYSINTPKTEAGVREIPMVAGVKEAFEMEREYQAELGIESISRVDGYDDFIFVNKEGRIQHQGTLNKALKRIMRDCNDQVLLKHDLDTDPVLLPNFSCHVLRHTFATRLCESGINIKVIQSVLGHVDISTTMDIYVDVMSETKKKELASFDGYMASVRA